MLGFRSAGKSSVGNTILGHQLFQSKKTVQRAEAEGTVAGRNVIIVKAPGWGETQLLKDTSVLAREEITLSVSPCPHAILLVMRTGMKFTETSRRAVQEHVELLGDTAWSHTILLFTHGEWLGIRSIEQFIESEGKPLQWVVEKCRNRYHVFSNSNEGRDAQVNELFKKIEETIAENEGRHYEIDTDILKAVERRIEGEKTTAEEMRKKHEQQRDFLTAAGGDAQPGTCSDNAKSEPGADSKLGTGTETLLRKKQLRIVLLGQLHAGKSVLGNSLLGIDEFDSENAVQSVRKEGRVSGREITVVNAPGWGQEQSVRDTPEFIKEEIMLGVSQCAPGPHVLFLVVRVDAPFTEVNRSAVQGHVDLLGTEVWKHTVLLFSSGEGRGDVSVEQCIKQGGKPLRWLVERCKNRHGVVSMKSSPPGKEPLDVADRVVTENNGDHYEMDRCLLKEVEKKREAAAGRGRERNSKVVKQSEGLCKGLEKMKIRGKPESGTTAADIPSPPRDRRLILLGHRGAGKTAAANTILGHGGFHTGHGVESVKAEAHTSERHVTVIRASDWPREQLLSHTTELTKQEITLSLSLCPPGPHCILVVVNVRLKFTEASRRAVQEHLELLSENAWSYSLVLFTCEERLEDSVVEQYIESEGKYLQWLVDKCGNRYHVLNTKCKDESQVRELLQKIEYMVSENGGSHFKPDGVILSKVVAQREVETKRAEARRLAVQEHRQELQAKLKQ
ncbi:hypothetical protein ACEWY4_019685 [Coilia grayii]|uniref:AIG1-type G domain-containing protein n=1 Tax=Coilia grayii TaxID=363190 RepID=A0ABD1JAI4_9TELE